MARYVSVSLVNKYVCFTKYFFCVCLFICIFYIVYFCVLCNCFALIFYYVHVLFQDCISLGSGEAYITEYRSFVLYHNNTPRWSEVLKLSIPVDHFRDSHLRFEFRHCSSKTNDAMPTCVSKSIRLFNHCNIS